MFRPLSFHTLDVFTDKPYRGNPLAVVLEADGLSTARMQAMAREFNLSETIFVMAPRDPANTARVRIFFPTAEIPFAGHPTLGCAVLLATLRNGEGDFTDKIVLEEEAGLVPVELARKDDLVTGRFCAPVLPHTHAGAAPVGLLEQALGLPEEKIGFANHQPATYQGGPAFLYAPVADLDALAAARPIEPYWSELMEAGQVDSAYLYTLASTGSFRARMFSPTAGVPEDPATGSASAILAAQLLQSGVLPEGESRFSLVQGVEMGRESQIGLSIRVTDGALAEVRITGSAVTLARGEIFPPPEAP
ncbi:PhzF family phenazine biosynthesis protein [Aliiruegeria lutimaris]|uniref:Trans-2,3-dihydro-3-hydroxyanthranilate isomerase n=1 Tax=Aliiruegeria lutimaris TaxID=571298 RepID=A0A1G8JZN7_9RHOB|nr:PhzF family phenazine biosynthesis protein [Aliiruegeria lutimaris]SDI36030.1 trans-2,3-dihydro-3-hydroxyanthranilate isomerase [Aliiruegeria lutimaris]